MMNISNEPCCFGKHGQFPTCVTCEYAKECVSASMIDTTPPPKINNGPRVHECNACGLRRNDPNASCEYCMHKIRCGHCGYVRDRNTTRCPVCTDEALPKGTKLDSDKPRWSLLPNGTIAKVIAVLEFGAKKYSVDNWQKVTDPKRRYYDAAMRHIDAWRMEEPNDPDSGLPHLSHAVCCLLFLLWFEGDEDVC